MSEIGQVFQYCFIASVIGFNVAVIICGGEYQKEKDWSLSWVFDEDGFTDKGKQQRFFALLALSLSIASFLLFAIFR